MRMLNCHVHWLPRSVFEDLCERKNSYPYATRNSVGGYDLFATYGRVGVVGYRRNVWFDLEDHFRHFELDWARHRFRLFARTVRNIFLRNSPR